jgi:hypothetical protein
MHYIGASAFTLAAATVFAAPVQAATITPGLSTPGSQIIHVQNKQNAGRDCTPYNGPFGFYGNVWCQPPNEMSYMRNLGSRWPMETPPSLRKAKPQDNSTDW